MYIYTIYRLLYSVMYTINICAVRTVFTIYKYIEIYKYIVYQYWHPKMINKKIHKTSVQNSLTQNNNNIFYLSIYYININGNMHNRLNELKITHYKYIYTYIYK